MVGNQKDVHEIKKSAPLILEFYRDRYGNPLSVFIMTEKEFEKAGEIKKSIERGIIIR